MLTVITILSIFDEILRKRLFSIKRKTLLCLLLSVVLTAGVSHSIFCQSAADKYYRYYSPIEYDLQPQNWAVLQDNRGIIYVGNQAGLLEFDSVSWQTIKVPNNSVRSLAINDSGTIYLGGTNEIGFFILEPKGTLSYISLLDRLPEDKRNIGSVWRTHATKEGIYFQSSKYLLRWDTAQKTMQVWQPDRLFNLSFACKDKLFIRQGGIGLMHISGDSLELIPGGERFASEGVFMIAPFDSRKLLIATQASGFYLYDGKTTSPFPREVKQYLKEKVACHGIRLACGDFALATRLGGLVITDARGNIKKIYDKDSGLKNDYVRYAFEDSGGNLWLALANGIAKIEHTSPLSIYDNPANLPGLVLSVVRHGAGKDLYVGTLIGLYRLTASGKFRAIPGIPGMCNALLSIDDTLLAATGSGVFLIGEKIKRIGKENPSYVLLRSGLDQNRIFVGTAYGLLSLYLRNGQFTEERQFKNITQSIRTIFENKKGDLWLGTRTKGVVKVVIPEKGTVSNPQVILYDTGKGLPKGEIHVFRAAGHVMFASVKGIFRFDEDSKTFSPDFTFGPEFAGGEDGRGVFRIVEDKNKHIWLHSKFKNIQAIPQSGGVFILNSIPFLRIPGYQVNAIYPEPDRNITWFASNNGLLSYNAKITKKYDFDFPVLLRSVVVNGKYPLPTSDAKKHKTGEDGKSQIPVIEYADRNLRFEFAAPFFEDEASNRYRYLLEGYDKDWSAWSAETRKDYTNLDSGNYRFRVQAKNVYEQLSPEASFRFKVLPPWFKTWWAFLLYAALFFLLMFLAVRWRSIKLEREKQRLEQIIVARTKEIKEKNKQLEKQTAQLKEQSGKLKELDRIKNRFFANISHEFRTPLTLIMGPLEQIRSDYQDENLTGKADLMLRNSRRLLTLINQLLDLSKLDSGGMSLQASWQNIIPFLKGIAASFESLIQKKEIEFKFNAEEEDISLYFDPGKMEQVAANLLANAVKFTPRGGQVTVTVRANFPPGFVEISVRDTGIGIPKDQLPHIFDRFYQVDSLGEQGQKGTGIGLALAKELVSLHHGEIVVNSSQGKGTEFIIRLPMGKAHLRLHEIVDQEKRPVVPADSEQTRSFYLTGEEEIEAAAGEAESAAADDRDSEKKNIILIVEDNRDVRKYIREPLEPFYAVVEAADGEEGIKKAKEIIPDLVISDVMMPGVDGYELCRVLKTDIKTSHVPIILLTAKAGDESIIQGLETGADDYITKPFNIKMLLTRVKNLIDLRCQLQQKIQRQMQLQPAEITVSSMDQEFIKELQDVIEMNLQDSEFNVDQLSKKLYMSRTSLYRKIEALTGESPSQFIRSYRLKRAAQLLKGNFGNVTEVAYEVGFSSSAYFTKCFREKFQQIPSDYQEAEAI